MGEVRMSTIAAGAPARSSLGPWVVPLLALAVFVNYIDRGNLATAAPQMKDELGLTATQVGLLTSAFFWTYVPAQLLAGWMAERWNAYRTLALGLAAWSVATLLTGFAQGFAMIFGLRLLLGIGESAAFPCSSKLIAQHVHGHKLGWANSLVAQGLSLGPAFGVFFGGLLMAQFGWRNVFIMFGALSLLWLVPWILATRRHSAEADAEVDEGPAPSFFDMLKRRELWGAALGHLAANYGFYFVISWLPLYLVKARGYTVPEMATIGGLVYLAYAAAAISSGWITDRWIASGWTPNRARKTISVVLFLGAAAGLLACGVLQDRNQMLVALFLAGIMLGGLSPQVFAIGQTLAGPRGAGKWVGLQNCAGNLSGIVGPIVTGMIVDATGSYDAAFILAAAVTLSGVVGWCFIIPKIAQIGWTPKAA